MKVTIIVADTVIKTMGVMNANNLLIKRPERERLRDAVLSV